MEHHRTATTAQATTPTTPWASASGGSADTDWDSVRTAVRYSLGNAAQGDGVWFGDDLLAAAAGLATGGRLGPVAPGVASEIAPSGQARFCPGGGRQLLGPCGPRGKKTGPNPTDRRKAGSKHHLLTDAQGIPLTVILTEANRHDVTQLLPLVDGIPPIAGKRGAPRYRPIWVQADRGYDSQPHRRALAACGIRTQIARRHTEHGSGLGVTRWVVERTIAWLHQFRRLRVRYERRPDIHEAFLKLGCDIICWRFLATT